MKELLEIYNAEVLTFETRIRLIKKMVNVLNFQVGANIYEDIAEELCNSLKEKETFNTKVK